MNQLCTFAAAVAVAYVLLSQADGVRLNSGVQNSIEARVIVDKLAISRWKNNFTSPRDPDSKRFLDTKRQMTTFIKSVFIGVNAIFGGLRSSGINVDARIVSIEFVPYETISTHVFDGTRVNSDKVLETFGVWLRKKRFSRVDHHVLFTGWDMSNGTSSAVAGLAYVGQMCDDTLSLSAVEIRSNIAQAVQTLTHELGHSLGAQHDGDSNSCPVDTSMIMDFNGGDNSTKNFQFSKCSIDYFRNFIQSLNLSPGGNCMTPANTVTPRVQGIPLGQLYDPDTICKMSLGPKSYFGRSFYGPAKGRRDYSDICTAIFCFNDKTNLYHSVAGTDGFSCGSGKICSLGHCVRSIAVSTRMSDTCPFGDTPSDAYVHANKSCDELTAYGDYSYCYDDYFKSSCCASCQAGLTNAPGCEYGDKRTWCRNLTLPMDCNWNSEECCSSCKNRVTNDPECPYGDKAEWCATVKYPYTCTWNSATCCQSCKRYRTSDPDCPYGDKAAWCATEQYPYTCNSNKNRATCCQSCKKYETSIPGCKYGDKQEWCRNLSFPQHCRQYGADCCASCRYY